jgi:hypothetical protein
MWRVDEVMYMCRLVSELAGLGRNHSLYLCLLVCVWISRLYVVRELCTTLGRPGRRR